MSKQSEQNESPINRDDIVAAVVAGVSAALANAPQSAVPENLGETIAVGVANAIRSTSGPRKIGIAEYRAVTPFNPTGAKNSERPPMLRNYFQNGHAIQSWFVTDADIIALDELEAGKYLDNRVTCTVIESNSGDNDRVNISYPCGRPEDRQANALKFASFSDLLQKIVHEIRNPQPKPERPSVRARLAQAQSKA